ncbi:MAG: murein biosynthesis integral membrane protein MurJ [bacterium]|nr:murein biosynthesis integral membrane protein MurJ [bacterium]
MMRNFLQQGKVFLLKRQSNILSAATVISLFYGLSMLLGLLRDRLLIGHFYGCCSKELDVYLAAFRLPDTIFQLLVIGALSAAFIPVFSEHLLKDKREAFGLASSFINLLVVIFFVLAGLIFIFARPISIMITGNFSLSQIDLMVGLTRLMLFAQFFFLLSNFLTGIIQSHERFLVPAISPVVYNLGIIIGIVFLSPIFGIYGPAIGVVLGALLHFLVQLPLLINLGGSWRPSFDFKHPGVREIGKLMLPRTLALAVSQVEASVTLFLATSLISGSLTIFYLASNLMQLPIRLVGIPLGQATLPALSLKRRENFDQFQKILLTSLWQIVYLVLPATAILLVLRVPVVRLAFGARGFPWAATVLTAQTLAIFSIAIIAQACIQLLIRGFYALHNTKKPLLIGLVSVVLNVVLSIWLTFDLGWGVLGLATATSIASLLQVILLFIYLDRLVKFNKKTLLFPFLKMGLAAIATAFFLWIPMRILDRFILDTTRTINLAILTATATLVGMGVYLFFSWVLKIEELDVFVGLARRVSQWRKVLRESEVLQETEEILQPAGRPQS